MATIYDVVKFLRPSGGWIIRGEDFNSIEFIEAEPFSEKEFEDGFVAYDNFVEKEEKAKLDNKKLLLEKLGITEEEAKLLLS